VVAATFEFLKIDVYSFTAASASFSYVKNVVIFWSMALLLIAAYSDFWWRGRGGCPSMGHATRHETTPVISSGMPALLMAFIEYGRQ
jgi:hypothetical protein